MDRSVPRGAATLLAFIYETETSRTPPECYEVIYGHNQHKLAKPLTSMTLDEVQAAQRNWSRHNGSSAAGAPQFMRATLKGLIAELGLRGSQKLDADLQDRLAYHLLKRRGYEDFIAGRISQVTFAKNLAMEWASFPVLTTARGQRRTVQRGQSYYAGDGLNKALVAPEKVEATLNRVLAAQKAAGPREAPPMPKTPETPKPAPTGKTGGKAGIAALLAAFMGLGAVFSSKIADAWNWFVALF